LFLLFCNYFVKFANNFSKLLHWNLHWKFWIQRTSRVSCCKDFWCRVPFILCLLRYLVNISYYEIPSELQCILLSDLPHQYDENQIATPFFFLSPFIHSTVSIIYDYTED
jgi:uncharacterized membrane protein